MIPFPKHIGQPRVMKTKRLYLVLAALAVALLVSACGSGFGASSWPGLSLDAESNTVFVAYNQAVYALQAENGVERWHFPSESDNAVSFFAAPTLAEDGQLLVGAYNNALYSLDTANGSLNWSFDVAANRYIGSPQANGAGFFAPNADRHLYALSADGQLQWTFEGEEAFWAQPAYDGQTLYVPAVDHMLYAVDAQSGRLVWEQDLEGSVVGRPALGEDGTLYVGTFGAEVIALDSANGRILWRTSTSGWVWNGPALADGVVYAADLEGIVYALNAESGAQLWQVTADGAITGSPLVAFDHVYVGTENGQLLSINLDGRIQWTQTLEGQLYSSPMAAEDLILIGVVEADHIVTAVDQNGQVQWTFRP